MRDGFIFYRSFYESAKALDDQQRLALYEAIFELGLNQNETKQEPLVNAFVNLIKPQIDANNRRYENGKKGGRPANKKPNNNLTETKDKPKEKEKDKEKDKEKEKGCRLEHLPKLEKSSLYEFMKSHCIEKKVDLIEIEKFTDYWKSQTNQKAIKKDWKATFRNWCRSEWVKKDSSSLNEVDWLEANGLKAN